MNKFGCGVQDVNLETSNSNVFLWLILVTVTTTICLTSPFMDPTNNVPLCDDLYLEKNDLSGGLQDDFNFEEYLNFFDDEDAQNLSLDVSQLLGSEDALPGQKTSPEELEKEVVEKKESGEGSSSKQDADVADFDSASKYTSLKKTSHMFAPPSFASSQFQTKDAAIRLHAAQSSGSVHVTAGMIRISNMTTLAADSSMGWSYDKSGNLNVVLSFGLVQGDDEMSSTRGKTGGITATRAVLIFLCFWVLLLAVSFKIGTIVSSR